MHGRKARHLFRRGDEWYAIWRARGGGGLAEHGECIEVLALPRCRTLDFILDGTLSKSPGLMFGLLWADQMISKGEKKGEEEASIMTGELLLRSVAPS
mmetsp:Transcript_11132/g.20138  ORF Transcript_11132/g.20138 Transcript_11132/m.20138 type:complete len:98 (+) Transcript_11132:755-1048(+)